MGQKSPSPSSKSEDESYYTSFLRSQSIPQTLDFGTPPIMAAGLRGGRAQGAEEEESPRARGRVKSMIHAIERVGRIRSNTLPSISSARVCDIDSPTGGRHSAGSTPSHGSPLMNGVLVRQVSDASANQSDSLERSNKRTRSEDLVASRSVSGRPFTNIELRKLSTTFEVSSVEESSSYVRLHPPALENTLDNDSGLSQPLTEGEEEGEGPGKGSRTEEVFISLEDREQSCDSLDMPSECSGERVNDDKSVSSSPRTSDELDRMLDRDQNGSLVNLYQEAEEDGGSPQMEGEKQRKKKKWRLFKKRKSTEEKVLGKVGRSQSDAPSEVQSVERRDKIRSVSSDAFLGTGGGRRRKMDRYTIYMQDYSAKLEERKKMSPQRNVGERLSTSRGGIDDVDRASTDDGLEDRTISATPPAEMTPLTFKQSLFCNQLKYKLRSALQNIHTPLTLNHAYQHLQLGDNGFNFDTRYQLILLIQHALQQTQWRQDDMESALLTEILRMVEPLPNEL